MMKRISFVLLAICLGFVQYKSVAQELKIKGGYEQTLMICANGSILAAGTNEIVPSGYFNILGTGNTSSYLDIPTIVQTTDNAYFVDVAIGEGNNYLALTCEGIVYGWGINENGEAGNNSLGQISTPTPVLRGDAPANNVQGYEQNLGNIKSIGISSTNSYALTNDGFVLAWGTNLYGGLSNGTNTGSALTPEFVQADYDNDGVSDGLLANVIEISVRGGVVLALVDDGANGDAIAGDGIGNVYSWGGTSFGSENLGRSSDYKIAAPVHKLDIENDVEGEILNNIKSVKSGSTMGLALDADNSVWAWGQHGWNCLAGTSTIPEQVDYAEKVIAGEYEAVSGKKHLSNVRMIGTGVGFCAALTYDGYLLVWGNNEDIGGRFGNGFIGTNSCETGPQFTKYDVNLVADDIVSFSLGSNFGYFLNQSNDVYCWGANESGQLGLGSTTDQDFPVEFALSSGCELPLINPYVDLTLNNYLCRNETATIDSRLIVPSSDLTNYSFAWEYSATANPYNWSNISNATTGTIDVDQPGWYRVTVDYISNGVCNSRNTAAQGIIEMELTGADFYDPIEETDTLKYCGSLVDAYVRQNDPAHNGVYEWYTDRVGGMYLGTSEKEQEVQLEVDFLSVNQQSYLQAWVEDVSIEYGSVIPDFDYTTTSTGQPDQSATLFKVKEQGVTLKSFDFRADAYIQGVSKEFTPVIFATKTYFDGKPIEDRDSIVFQGTPQLISLTQNDRTKNYSVNIDWKVPDELVDVQLALGMIANDNNGFFLIKYREISLGDYPFYDDLEGNSVELNASTSFGYPSTDFGSFFNVQFEKAVVQPCGRVLVRMKEDCPPIITSSGEIVENSVSPNPTTGVIHIHNEEASSVWVISDVLGNQLLSGTDDSADISAFENGVYLLRIDDSIIKIIKE